MKTRNIRFALIAAAFAAGAVHAQEGVQDTSWYQSSASRDAVRAELHAAAKAGALSQGEASFNVVPAASASMLTRAQVKAEAREAMRLGLIPVQEGSRVATAAELEQIRQAGLRAVEASTQYAAK